MKKYSLVFSVFEGVGQLRPNFNVLHEPFSPRCTECRHGLVMRILSVRLSVCHALYDKMVE